MSDILILSHIDYCPPDHLGVLGAARCDFSVLRVYLGEVGAYAHERQRPLALTGSPARAAPTTLKQSTQRQ